MGNDQNDLYRTLGQMEAKLDRALTILEPLETLPSRVKEVEEWQARVSNRAVLAAKYSGYSVVGVILAFLPETVRKFLLTVFHGQ